METATTMVPAKSEAYSEIEKAKAEGCNLLLPSQDIVGLSEFHKPVVERVLLSTNPADGDVYEHDNAKDGPAKKWRPTKQGLMKLSVCAGVIWSVTESRRIDNGADRNYCAYRAVGGLRKADGQPVFFSADYDIDLEVIEEELREQYEKKALAKDKEGKPFHPTKEKQKEYVDYCVKRDLLQKRKNKLKLCEAGAMNRVLRSLLGIKQAYTAQELKKPFVMVRIVFRPDFSDKEVRQQFINAQIKAMTGVYGPDAISQTLNPEAEPIDVTPINDDDNGKEPTPTPDPEPVADVAPDPEPVAEQDPNNADLDFENMDAADQGATLERMAKRKNWDIEGYLNRSKKSAAKDLSAEKRKEIFKFLCKKEG